MAVGREETAVAVSREETAAAVGKSMKRNGDLQRRSGNQHGRSGSGSEGGEVAVKKRLWQWAGE